MSRQGNSIVHDKETAEPHGPRRGARLRAGLVLACAAMVVVVVGGFFAFAAQVAGQSEPGAQIGAADGIVVLTGGRARLEPAVELLRAGKGRKLLVSGVDAGIGDETLRLTLGVGDDLYACCIDVDRQALDTAGNAEGSAAWARRNGYASLIVVTNDYHMPRALLEMRRALPDRELIAYPVVNETGTVEDMAALADRYRVLLSEYAKYVVAQARVFP